MPVIDTVRMKGVLFFRILSKVVVKGGYQKDYKHSDIWQGCHLRATDLKFAEVHRLVIATFE